MIGLIRGTPYLAILISWRDGGDNGRLAGSTGPLSEQNEAKLSPAWLEDPACLRFYPLRALRCDHISHHLIHVVVLYAFVLQPFKFWHVLRVRTKGKVQARTFLLHMLHIFLFTHTLISSFCLILFCRWTEAFPQNFLQKFNILTHCVYTYPYKCVCVPVYNDQNRFGSTRLGINKC